jgi:hypothetical protein
MGVVLLEKSRRGGKGIGTYWWASCDCGLTFEVLGKYVRAGRTVSCGNCRGGLGFRRRQVAPLSEIPAGHREHYRSIIRQLVAIGNPMAVTPEMYNGLLRNRCVGCGAGDTHVELATAPQRNKPEDHTRLVPICGRCSEWRGGRNVEKWLEHCLRVAASVAGRVG